MTYGKPGNMKKSKSHGQAVHPSGVSGPEGSHDKSRGVSGQTSRKASRS